MFSRFSIIIRNKVNSELFKHPIICSSEDLLFKSCKQIHREELAIGVHYSSARSLNAQLAWSTHSEKQAHDTASFIIRGRHRHGGQLRTLSEMLLLHVNKFVVMNEIKSNEWFNWKLSYNSYLNVMKVYMKFHKILWKVHYIS